MNEERYDNQIRTLANISLVITLMLFTLILILMNVLLHWEKWPVPILAAGFLAVIIMHVLEKPGEKARIHIYGVILITEIFYYSVNIDTIYDSTPVVITGIIIFCMTQEKKLTRICLGVGIFGMVYHILELNSAGKLVMNTSDAIRTTWHFIMVVMAGLVSEKLVSGLNRADQLFSRQIEAMEAENRSTSDFLANVSHEIRTPINAVIGLTDVCMEKTEDPEMKRTLQSIEEAGKRVAEQVSDILDYSEIDMKKIAINNENYMISSVLNDLSVGITPYLPENLEFVIDVDASVPAVMRTDVSKLKKILWHLVLNGLKYTKEGGVLLRITATRQSYGVNLCIEVEDTGVGMTEVELDRVFDRFYQSDSSRTRSSSGLGLGLAIVSGFVSAMNGFCAVESEKGKGTKVRVSLPQEVVDDSECMSVRNKEDLCLGAFLRVDKLPNPNVRVFYDSMLRHMVQGLHTAIHRVDSGKNLKELSKSIHLTHLFVGEEEYLEEREYLQDVAKRIAVFVVVGRESTLVDEPGIRLLPKPFFCFPVVGILNSGSGAPGEHMGALYLPEVRALVVDDEPMNLTVAASMFSRYGMTVVTAASGHEAIERCGKEEFDIVFMDHMMPGMDGVEAMRRIRREAGRRGQTFPIVALTANAISSAREMFLAEGFDAFVSKPIDRLELERVLKRVMPDNLVTYREVSGNDPAGTSGSKTAGSAASKTEATGSEASGTEASGYASQGFGDKDSCDGSDKNIFTVLSERGLDVKQGLFYCQEDTDLYRVLLKQFAEEEPRKRTECAKFLKSNDCKGYTILVHAIKSNAKTIGDAALSEAAKALEDAGKREDLEFIHRHDEAMFTAYGELAALIRRLLGMPEPTAEEADDDVLEFGPAEETAEEADDDVLEFGPAEETAEEADDDVLEFGPAEETAEEADDDVLEFGPAKKGE